MCIIWLWMCKSASNKEKRMVGVVSEYVKIALQWTFLFSFQGRNGVPGFPGHDGLQVSKPMLLKMSINQRETKADQNENNNPLELCTFFLHKAFRVDPWYTDIRQFYNCWYVIPNCITAQCTHVIYSWWLHSKQCSDLKPASGVPSSGRIMALWRWFLLCSSAEQFFV